MGYGDMVIQFYLPLGATGVHGFSMVWPFACPIGNGQYLALEFQFAKLFTQHKVHFGNQT